MKKKKRQHKTKHRRGNHRNAGPVPVASRRRPRLSRRAAHPDWKTTLAALAGGAGGAALGGLVVNQQILSPEAVGIGMIGVGGATAYFADGNTRVLGNSVAAAGAGQLALALMAKRAIATDRAAGSAAGQPPHHATAAGPPMLGPGAAPAGPPRKSASGGGTVVDLFRDAALELEQLDDDEWRFGGRDAEEPAGEADAYDLAIEDAA